MTANYIELAIDEYEGLHVEYVEAVESGYNYTPYRIIVEERDD